MRENEYKFYGRFKDRCKSLMCVRVENALGSGFPDAIILHRGRERMTEFKAEYPGGHVYMRNTQMSFCIQFLAYGVDIPVVTGTLDSGMWIVPFTEMLKLDYQEYKGSYKRCNTKDFVGIKGDFIPQRCNWDETVVPLLYPS